MINNRAVPIDQSHILPSRGNAVVAKHNKVKELPVPNIVKTQQYGNTTVHFADNAYRDKTPEEHQQVIKNLYAVAWRIWEDIERRRMEGEATNTIAEENQRVK